MGIEWGTSKEEFNKVLLNNRFQFFPESSDISEHYEGESPAGKINIACEFFNDQLCYVSAFIFTYIPIKQVAQALSEKYGGYEYQSEEYEERYIWDDPNSTCLLLLYFTLLKENPRICACYTYHPLYNKKLLSDMRIF